MCLEQFRLIYLWLERAETFVVGWVWEAAPPSMRFDQGMALLTVESLDLFFWLPLGSIHTFEFKLDSLEVAVLMVL